MNSQTIISNGNSQAVLNELPNLQTNFQTATQSSAQTDGQTNVANSQEADEVSRQQTRYANILQICSWAGIGLMVITFLLYMSGVLSPVIKPSELPLYWGMNVHEYASATQAASGWMWMKQINHADYLSLIGLAFLGLVSMLGYLSLLPGYLRKKDIPYVTMVGLEIIVICLAASGFVHVGA